MRKWVLLIILLVSFETTYSQSITDNEASELVSQFQRDFQEEANNLNALFGSNQLSEEDLDRVRRTYFFTTTRIEDIFSSTGEVYSERGFLRRLSRDYTPIKRALYVNPVYCNKEGVEMLKQHFSFGDSIALSIDFILVSAGGSTGLKVKNIIAGNEDDLCLEINSLPRVYVDSDQDGVPDYIDDCPRTPHGSIVDKNGCPIAPSRDPIVEVEPSNLPSVDSPMDKDQDGDGIPDALDLCKNTPSGPEYCWNHWKQRKVKRITPYGCIDCDLDGRHPDKPSFSRYYDEDDNNFCLHNKNKCPKDNDTTIVIVCDTSHFVQRQKTDSVLIVSLKQRNERMAEQLKCYNDFVGRYKNDDTIKKELIVEETKLDKILLDITKKNKETPYTPKDIADSYHKMKLYGNFPIPLRCGKDSIDLKIDRLTAKQHILIARALIKNWLGVDSLLSANNGKKWRNEKINFGLVNLSAAIGKTESYDDRQKIWALLLDLVYTNKLEKDENKSTLNSELEKALMGVKSSYDQGRYAKSLRHFFLVFKNINNPELKTKQFELLEMKFIVAQILILNKGEIESSKELFDPRTLAYEVLHHRIDRGKELLKEVEKFDPSGLNESEEYYKLQKEVKKFRKKYVN